MMHQGSVGTADAVGSLIRGEAVPVHLGDAEGVSKRGSEAGGGEKDVQFLSTALNGMVNSAEWHEEALRK